MSILRLEGLNCGYLSVPVVRDLSITVEAGEVVALLGANGAGKTSTMLTIAGLLDAVSGTVIFDGRDVTRQPAHHRARAGLALVPDDRSLFFGLTARENLRLGRSRLKRRGGDDREALALLPELEKCLDRRAGVLSGGEQQMLSLGRALVSRPKLLLVDEMSLGLAPLLVNRLLPVLRNIAREHGAGVLFVEQHVGLALEVADRAYVLSHGTLALEARAADLRGRRDLLEAAYLGGDPRTAGSDIEVSRR